MLNEKNFLRKQLLALRDSLPQKELCISDLSSAQEFNDAETVFCYVSAGSEVRTHSFIREALKTKRVVVPYCTDKEGTMIAVEIKSFDELEEGFFGILSPKNPAEFPKNEIDFVITPAVAFDEDGYRLGYGKGYYDRFLSDINPYKLGICKKELLVEKLPHDEFDIKMDKVIVI